MPKLTAILASEEMEVISPRMTLEEQLELTHVFDVKEKCKRCTGLNRSSSQCLACNKTGIKIPELHSNEDDSKSIQQLRSERQARDRKAWLAKNRHLKPLSFAETHGRVNKEYHKNDK